MKEYKILNSCLIEALRSTIGHAMIGNNVPEIIEPNIKCTIDTLEEIVQRTKKEYYRIKGETENE